MITEDYQDNDQLLKDLFQQSVFEPTHGLKQKIMQEIHVKKEVFEYQPVIGKKMWIALGVGFAALMIFLFNYDRREGFTLIEKEKYTNLFNWELPSGIFNGWFELQLNQIPSFFLVALIALIVVGVYFMVSIRFGNRSFSNY